MVGGRGHSRLPTACPRLAPYPTCLAVAAIINSLPVANLIYPYLGEQEHARVRLDPATYLQTHLYELGRGGGDEHLVGVRMGGVLVTVGGTWS